MMHRSITFLIGDKVYFSSFEINFFMNEVKFKLKPYIRCNESVKFSSRVRRNLSVGHKIASGSYVANR